MRIGLMGEDLNDTSSIGSLLTKDFSKHSFVTVFKNIKGDNWGSAKTERMLQAEAKSQEEDKQYDLLIFIRDLDDIKTNKAKIEKLNIWFKKVSSLFNNESLFLLNIYEIEALILADIATFNKKYGISHKFSGDPMMVKEPKEYLHKISNRKYKESHNPEIFKKIDIEIVKSRCAYLKAFIEDFTKTVN